MTTSSFTLNNQKVTDLPTPTNLGLQGIDERLAACEESLAPFVREAYIAPLIHAIDSVRAPLPLMREYAKEAMFNFLKQAQATRAAAEAASSNVPKTGFTTPREREQAVQDAARGVSGVVWDATVRDLTATRAKQGEKFAKDAVDALREADRAITATIAEFNGLIAFSTPTNMDRLAQITALRDELRTMLPSSYGPLLDGFIAAADEDRETLFTQAVAPILDELAKLSIQQLGKRLELRVSRTGGPLEKEHAAVTSFRERLLKRKAEKIPESLTLARVALPQIVAAFSLVFGWHASALTRGEYEMRYLRGGQTPDPLDVHPGWMTRAIGGFSVEDPANPIRSR